MRLFILLLTAVTLTSCAQLAPNGNSYPRELSNQPDTENQPMMAAGFVREKIVMYAPDDMSVGYNLFEKNQQIASTIYRYKTKQAFGEQLKLEKSQIQQIHPAAKILADNKISIKDKKATYSAQRVEFSFPGNFAGKNQDLYSELILFTTKGELRKVRTTSPLSQREATKQKVNELLKSMSLK